GLADISLGLIFGELFYREFGNGYSLTFSVVGINNWHVFAIFFAILPDADLLLQRKDSNHRSSLLHRPLFCYLLIVLPVAFYSVPLLLLSFWCLTWHYVHDSLDSSGVMWLWPFNNYYYQLFDRDHGFCLIKKRDEVEFSQTALTLDQVIAKDYSSLTPQVLFAIILFLIAMALLIL
ncbi:MAG: hypothetical protein CO133_02525, partial [Candidatus Komeilibacteria bacterium CG_4_9_14_3_um_filter_37_5]